jgi:hypothetical protein
MKKTQQRRERGERMFYSDYNHELAKERMQTAIKEREHANLIKQMRLLRKDPRGGWVARTVAPIVSLVR